MSGIVVPFVGSLTGASGHKDGVGSDVLLNQPMGMCLSSTGNVYFVDAGSYTVRMVTPQGVVVMLLVVFGFTAVDVIFSWF